jgi:hypothetical protein
MTAYTTKFAAKRAAEKAIKAGTAPGIDYYVASISGSRFEIVWKNGVPVEVVGAKPNRKHRTPTTVEHAAIDEPVAPKAKRARQVKPAEAEAPKPPRSTSPKSLHRYRDLAMTALRARAKK